eukprot:6196550-Pleurochrysis_carterae.AAC.2
MAQRAQYMKVRTSVASDTTRRKSHNERGTERTSRSETSAPAEPESRCRDAGLREERDLP